MEKKTVLFCLEDALGTSGADGEFVLKAGTKEYLDMLRTKGGCELLVFSRQTEGTASVEKIFSDAKIEGVKVVTLPSFDVIVAKGHVWPDSEWKYLANSILHHADEPKQDKEPNYKKEADAAFSQYKKYASKCKDAVCIG